MDNCWQGSFDVSQGCPKLRQMGWVGLKGVDLQLVLKGFVLLHKRSDAGPSARPNVQQDVLPPACNQRQQCATEG